MTLFEYSKLNSKSKHRRVDSNISYDGSCDTSAENTCSQSIVKPKRLLRHRLPRNIGSHSSSLILCENDEEMRRSSKQNRISSSSITTATCTLSEYGSSLSSISYDSKSSVYGTKFNKRGSESNEQKFLGGSDHESFTSDDNTDEDTSFCMMGNLNTLNKSFKEKYWYKPYNDGLLQLVCDGTTQIPSPIVNPDAPGLQQNNERESTYPEPPKLYHISTNRNNTKNMITDISDACDQNQLLPLLSPSYYDTLLPSRDSMADNIWNFVRNILNRGNKRTIYDRVEKVKDKVPFLSIFPSVAWDGNIFCCTNVENSPTNRDFRHTENLGFDSYNTTYMNPSSHDSMLSMNQNQHVYKPYFFHRGKFQGSDNIPLHKSSIENDSFRRNRYDYAHAQHDGIDNRYAFDSTNYTTGKISKEFCETNSTNIETSHFVQRPDIKCCENHKFKMTKSNEGWNSSTAVVQQLLRTSSHNSIPKDSDSYDEDSISLRSDDISMCKDVSFLHYEYNSSDEIETYNDTEMNTDKGSIAARPKSDKIIPPIHKPRGRIESEFSIMSCGSMHRRTDKNSSFIYDGGFSVIFDEPEKSKEDSMSPMSMSDYSFSTFSPYTSTQITDVPDGKEAVKECYEGLYVYAPISDVFKESNDIGYIHENVAFEGWVSFSKGNRLIDALTKDGGPGILRTDLRYVIVEGSKMFVYTSRKRDNIKKDAGKVLTLTPDLKIETKLISVSHGYCVTVADPVKSNVVCAILPVRLNPDFFRDDEFSQVIGERKFNMLRDHLFHQHQGDAILRDVMDQPTNGGDQEDDLSKMQFHDDTAEMDTCGSSQHVAALHIQFALDCASRM